MTGTPRSGTTPVGDMLAIARGARTLYEPMNAVVGDRRVDRYYEVPGSEGFSREVVDELVDDVAGLRLRLRPGLFPEDRGVRRLVKHVTGSQTLSTYRRCRLDPRLTTIVWKDPFAVFLAEHVAATRDVPVLVTVRPPAAVAASFKRLGWSFDVRDLVARLGQKGAQHAPLLDAGDLADPVVNAAVLWHVVNDAALAASRRTPLVRLVDLERVVSDREAAFRDLYAHTGLRWDARVESAVRSSGHGSGPSTPTGGRAHGGRRDPSAVNSYWSDVLSADEVALVERLDGALWEQVRAAAR